MTALAPAAALNGHAERLHARIGFLEALRSALDADVRALEEHAREARSQAAKARREAAQLRRQLAAARDGGTLKDARREAVVERRRRERAEAYLLIAEREVARLRRILRRRGERDLKNGDAEGTRASEWLRGVAAITGAAADVRASEETPSGAVTTDRSV